MKTLSIAVCSGAVMMGAAVTAAAEPVSKTDRRFILAGDVIASK